MDLRRQSFLGANLESVLKNTRLAVIGLCGGGSHIAQQLAHIGFMNLMLVDFDSADASNINRMVGLTAADVNAESAKTDVIARRILEVNPDANVVSKNMRWQECHDALKECDLVFGCVDSYGQRDQLESFCRRYLIAYIDIGMDVHGEEGRYFVSGQSIMSLPGQACMRCMGYLNDGVLAREAARYGAVGGKPQVVWPNGVLASMAVGQAMAILTAWNGELVPPLYIDYDGNRSIAGPSKRLEVINVNRCLHFSGPDAVGDVVW